VSKPIGEGKLDAGNGRVILLGGVVAITGAWADGSPLLAYRITRGPAVLANPTLSKVWIKE